MNTCKNMIILFRIHVSIPFQNDMQNEKYFYGHYIEFEYNHDYVKLIKYSYIYISMYTKYNYTYMCKRTFSSSYKCKQMSKNNSIFT